jgi:hypothetical protein
MLSRIISSLRNSLGVGRLASIIGSALFIGVVSSLPAEAKCFRNPFTGKQVCSLKDLDPTTGIPGSKEFAEQAWGEAGGSAFPSAAAIMRGRHGSSQGLDEFQRRSLRPHFGDLVDRVVVIYSAHMLDQWNAFGKEINLSGVDTAAQTYCNRIYIRDSYKQNDFQQLVLLSHEMTHSKQCEQLGGEGKFGFHYFREYKRAGLSYENNKLEQEASGFENQFAVSTPSNPSNMLGNYRLADGTIFFSNGRDAYCTFQNMEHWSFASDKALRPADSIPPLRNDGPCVVVLPAGNYRQLDGLIFFSNGKDAFCAYRRVPTGFIRQLNAPVPYDKFMRNDGICAGQ